MEMCYDGALVMPSSYSVMNEEEMTYVEGGNGWYNSTAFIGSAIDVALYAIPALAAANKACKAGKAVRAAIAAVKMTKKKLISVVTGKLASIGFSKAAQNLVGIAVGCIWTAAGLSIGGLVAYGIDCVDSNRHNGYCFG